MRLVTSLAAILLVFATQASSAVIGNLETRATCTTDTAKMSPLFRTYSSANTDHFYTTDVGQYINTWKNLGYKDEGVAGYVFYKQQPDTVPFFRLYKSSVKDHFYTTSTTERDAAVRDGYVLERTEGYVYLNTTACGVPLYRVYRPGAVDHFYTTSAAERDTAVTDGGYVREWVAANLPSWSS